MRSGRSPATPTTKWAIASRKRTRTTTPPRTRTTSGAALAAQAATGADGELQLRRGGESGDADRLQRENHDVRLRQHEPAVVEDRRSVLCAEQYRGRGGDVRVQRGWAAVGDDRRKRHDELPGL